MAHYKKTLAALIITAVAAGCETAPKTEAGKENLEATVEATLARLRVMDPSLQPFLDKSAGYVIFPSVGKGGLIVGGSYGRGIVYEGGVPIGYSDISQATVGAQVGAQKFAEVIAFETKLDLDRFKTGKFAFAANASAVAMKSGAGTSAKFQDGVAIFVEPIAGAMIEASVGGQSFTYQPK